MIWAVLALPSGLFLFFFSVYKSSHASGAVAVAWGLLGVMALSGIGAAILQILVPGFFGGVS